MGLSRKDGKVRETFSGTFLGLARTPRGSARIIVSNVRDDDFFKITPKTFLYRPSDFQPPQVGETIYFNARIRERSDGLTWFSFPVIRKR